MIELTTKLDNVSQEEIPKIAEEDVKRRAEMIRNLEEGGTLTIARADAYTGDPRNLTEYAKSFDEAIPKYVNGGKKFTFQFLEPLDNYPVRTLVVMRIK